MSSPKRNTKRINPQNKSTKSKKSIKYKAHTKNSIETNKSQFQEQNQELKNAKEILMIESERFSQQVDYGFVRSHYQGCSTFDKQSNGDWGSEMIQQIQIIKREEQKQKQKQKNILKINKNIIKQKSLKNVSQQRCKNNQQRNVNSQEIETQKSKVLEKQKQSYENKKYTYQKDTHKDIKTPLKNQKCKDVKKQNINTRFEVFNGTRVKIRQNNIQSQCFGLSTKQVVFDPKTFTQKTMTLQNNYIKNQKQIDKKKTIEYTSLSKSRRIHHMRTCSQNNSYLTLKKQKNPEQHFGSDRKLSQVIHSTSIEPLSSKWIKQNKNSSIQTKQQVNPHTFCIKQMVASYINKKQSQNIQKSHKEKVIKQFIYEPLELTRNKKQKMKQLRRRAQYKSRKQKFYQYFTHSLTSSNKSYNSQSNKDKDKKQIRIKNMHFSLEDKQDIVYQVENDFNKTKNKDKYTDRNKTQGKCFQKRDESLIKKQQRTKTQGEMSKIMGINPYMLKIIQIQQKYKQKIELQKLDIKNVFLS